MKVSFNDNYLEEIIRLAAILCSINRIGVILSLLNDIRRLYIFSLYQISLSEMSIATQFYLFETSLSFYEKGSQREYTVEEIKTLIYFV